MIVDGKGIAHEMLEETKTRAALLPEAPSFAAIAVSPSPATESYLRIKERQARAAGVVMEVISPSEATTDSLLALIADDRHDALIVQLPLPPHIDTERVLDAIPPEKDADVLSPRTREEGSLTHPIAGAVGKVLEKAGVKVKGMRSLVIGQGWLVGAPVTAWLAAEGADVTTITREAGALDAAQSADLIVSGAGVPGLLLPEHVKEGAVVIDVGTSELGGALAGDVDPKVAEKAAVFTPVPGGMGPIAVAYLMHNVVTLAERSRLQGR